MDLSFESIPFTSPNLSLLAIDMYSLIFERMKSFALSRNISSGKLHHNFPSLEAPLTNTGYFITVWLRPITGM